MPKMLMRLIALAGLASAAGWAVPASADLALSKVIVDIPADAPPRDDVELYNSGDERLYVVAEPAAIKDPGQPTQSRVESADPGVTGLLVSPQKLILEAGERKLLRVASVLPRDNVERVYRITVKPVAGDVTSPKSALKVYVGYDMLVIVRPQQVTGELQGVRDGNRLRFHNGSNTSVEIARGQQCDTAGKNCQTLPAMRLYAGADWAVSLPLATTAHYQVIHGGVTDDMTW